MVNFRTKKTLYRLVRLPIYRYTRVAGIEPTHAALEAAVLPLNYTPKINQPPLNKRIY